jgi:outer membrane immunogenic protein
MTKLRGVLLASVGVAVLSSSAIAADLPTMKGPPPAPVVAPYSWTGFNIGANIGYGWGAESDNLSTSDLAIPADSFTVEGLLGGVHAGYDWQINSLVLGVLGELDVSGLRGSKSTSSTQFLDGSDCASEGCYVTRGSLAFRNTWQAFLLARAGIAFDRLLVYGTGGLAIADDRESASISLTEYNGGYTDPDVFASASGAQTKTLYGWALGLGAEYALDAHWQIGAQYRYALFPKTTYTLNQEPITIPIQYKAGFSENILMLDVGYHF